jgi:hypothetical protein
MCRNCLNYGHPARMCKHKHPNCNTCAGPHLEDVCPQILNNCVPTPLCYHCKGNHKGTSTECPVYKKQLRHIQEMPFPNLHVNPSIKQHASLPVTLRNYPQMYTTTNRFDILQDFEDEGSDETTDVLSLSRKHGN